MLVYKNMVSHLTYCQGACYCLVLLSYYCSNYLCYTPVYFGFLRSMPRVACCTVFVLLLFLWLRTLLSDFLSTNTFRVIIMVMTAVRLDRLYVRCRWVTGLLGLIGPRGTSERIFTCPFGILVLQTSVQMLTNICRRAGWTRLRIY